VQQEERRLFVWEQLSLDPTTEELRKDGKNHSFHLTMRERKLELVRLLPPLVQRGLWNHRSLEQAAHEQRDGGRLRPDAGGGSLDHVAPKDVHFLAAPLVREAGTTGHGNPCAASGA
jgi:hypothetical protein